jgi:protoporphyrinogen oxidase
MLIDEQKIDVAIIGAGPAGLTAAYLLTKAGKRVTVIEKDPVYVGGISRTVEHEGFRFDIGGHRFFSKSREVVDLWNEILPDDFIERPRMSRIYYEGKFYSYPLRAFEALFNLGVIRSTLCMASYFRWKLFPSSARNCSASFSRPIPKKYGACPATKFRPTGRRSASRA